MKLPVPKEILAQHVAVLGKTRSGKSSVMRGLVEHLLERQQPVCIIDPKGDWWGIKLAADGKRPGYPVVIFGGEHGDLPINEHAGAHVAELFATGNRPCLIDLGGWMVGQRTRFWIEFASTLFKHTKGQRWLVVDEVHNFAPKGKVFDADAGKALHWTNRIASEGLGKGVSMLFASQRPQKVHNDTLTSAETLIAMRVLHPSDRGAVADWIKGCGDSEGSEVLSSLAQMDRGEGWVWSPEIGFGPKRVKFPMFETYDSFRPQTLEDTKKLKGWAEVNLDDVRAKLAAVVEQAKADDPRELRKQIAELQRQLKSSRPVENLSAPVRTKTVEKFVLKDGQLARAEKIIERLEQLRDRTGDFEEDLHTIAKEIRDALLKRERLHIPPTTTQPERPSPHARRVAPAEAPATSRRPARVVPPESNGNLPPGEHATLTAALQYEGLDRKRLGILTGYKRSSRDAYVARLQQRGLVEVRGPQLFPTAEGRLALSNSFEPLPTGDALIEYWRARLPEGERKTLEVLLEAKGADVDREVIDDATGYKRSSRDAYLTRLKARGLVEFVGRGLVKASDELFDS